METHPSNANYTRANMLEKIDAPGIIFLGKIAVIIKNATFRNKNRVL